MVRRRNTISGGTNSVYKQSNLSITNENYYACVLTNSCASVTSNEVVLMINTTPVMNVTELVLHKQTGDTIKFSVTPTGSRNIFISMAERRETNSGSDNKYL